VNLALDMAPKLVAGVVWVNATNLFDAAAGFGGVRGSGLRPRRRLGGAGGLHPPKGAEGAEAGGGLWPPRDGVVEGIDRTAKLYVGGKQARPDGGYSPAVWSPKGRAARPCAAWQPQGHPQRGRGRAGGEGLGQDDRAPPRRRCSTTSPRTCRRAGTSSPGGSTDLTGRDGRAEVEASVRRLFTYAAWADKYDGRVEGRADPGGALAMNEPVGIGVLCPDEAPLLGLVSVMAPAIAMGNRVVLVASEPFPLAATDFYQVLDTSDVPGGVVNILTGSHAELAPQLAGHMDVDAVWCFSSTDLSGVIEKEAPGTSSGHG
jgi:aldehyde dehydrogenase (NAD+)